MKKRTKKKLLRKRNTSRIFIFYNIHILDITDYIENLKNQSIKVYR